MVQAAKAITHDRMEEHSKFFRDLLLGFVKVHVLYHASCGEVYGAGISSELSRHGYKLSPGTLYPLLHNLEAADFLEREDRVVDGKVRKYYHITPLGEQAFEEAKVKILELVEEVTEQSMPARRSVSRKPRGSGLRADHRSGR
jgi:DNA-binding PadR family transcriptional regulator